MAQMQQYITQLENQVKKLNGDLQTSEREMVSARKRSEVEKFKSELSEISHSTRAKEKEKVMRLDNMIANMEGSLEENENNESGSES
jgi:exonuclease VII large subunit